MRFLNPNFLWALLLVLVPIIIHLFYFRRYKKVYFSNTNFLNEIKEEKATKNRLKHLLVLFSRIFAITFLVFAFAQPFIPQNSQINSIKKLVSLYIDNSFSMGTEGDGILLFDEAKETAQKIIESYNESNSFQIISNDFEAKHQRIVNKSEALELLKEIKITPSIQAKTNVLEKQINNSRNFSGEKIFYQLSDFQKNNELFESDTLHTINLVKFTPSLVRNISIQSVEFENPIFLEGQNNKLIVTIKNQSDEEKSGSFQLSINGNQKSLGNYTLLANSESIDTLTFTINENSWNEGKISLNDYPVIFDDNYYFAFYVEDKINVYSIYEGNKNNYIKAVFVNNENVNYKENNVNAINYNDFSNQHLVVINNLKSIPTGLLTTLKTYVNAGGYLLIVPNEKSDVQSYNQLFQSINVATFTNVQNTDRKVTEINAQHPLLNDIFIEKPNKIDLPNTKIHYVASKVINEEKVLSYSNLESFLSEFNTGKGKVYVLYTPLGNEFSNFTSQALYAPLVYKMAVSGVKSSSIAFPIQTNTSVLLHKLPKNSEAIVSIKNSETEIVPQKSIFNGLLHLQFPAKNLSSGFYEVVSNQNDYNALIALNYNRVESDLNYYSKQDLETHFATTENISIFENNLVQISESVKLLENGKSYWKLCIILALLFLAIEVLLLRFLPN